MKYCLIFILIVFVSFSTAAEFSITSDLKELTGDLTAQRYGHKDVNGNVCAVIKVLTDLEELSFESPLLEKSKIEKPGEYWVYLPKNTKRLKFKKEGIIPLTYEFPEKLEEGKVYILELTAKVKEQKIEDITISVLTVPKGASVFLDGVDKGGSEQIKTSVGNHELRVSKEGYETKVYKIDVSASRTLFKCNLLKKLSSDYIFVEGGSFQMGSNNKDDEKPVHSVTLSDFYISKYEVTQAQWKDVIDEEPEGSYGQGNKYPVYFVTWYDAVRFCNELSEKYGLEKCYSGTDKDIVCNFEANGYRLPTEAEWEYAARGGKKSKGYKFSGSDILNDVSWNSSNSNYKTHTVGARKPNELGIYDMTGNVWEWCNDWYESSYYEKGESINPAGPKTGTARTGRGGGWNDDPEGSLVTRRNSEHPGNNYTELGFRIVTRR